MLDGQHRNPEDHPDYFTTTFFHHPDELAREVRDAGLSLDAVLTVESPGSLLADLSPWWDDEQRRALLLALISHVEVESSLLGISASDGHRTTCQRVTTPGSSGWTAFSAEMFLSRIEILPYLVAGGRELSFLLLETHAWTMIDD